MTPASRVRTPRSARPPATCDASQGPDSRVSIPMTISGSAAMRRATEPSARPNAWTVRGSSGGSPATPRMPSVPNNCFPMLLLPDGNLDLNVRRRLKACLSLGQGGVDAKLLAGDDVGDIDRVCHHRLRPFDAAFRAGDGDVRGIDRVAGHRVAGMRSGESRLHRHLANDALLETKSQLRRNGPHELDAARQDNVFLADAEGQLAGFVDGCEIEHHGGS